MTTSSTANQNIILVAGKLIFCCQQIERHFKFILPFAATDDPKLSSIIARYQKMSKKTMGELAGQFVLATSGDTATLESLVKIVVDKRNILVHHFFDEHGANISSGKTEAVLSDLTAQHEEALSLLKMLQGVSVSILELMRDSEALGTENLNELNELCEKARSNLAI